MWTKSLTEGENRAGKTLDRLVCALIIYSIISFAIETLPEAARYQTFFTWSERIVVAIFTAEYILRTIANGWRYVRGFYGIIDLAAILPFYVSLGVADLRAIRILRLLRLLRMTKLWRYATAGHRLKVAFLEVKDELAVYCVLTAALIFLASVGIYYCEHEAQPETFRSVFHAMWWAVCTLSTVGYGDIYPVTLWGRIFTAIILILGLSVVSVPSGLLASALVKQPRQNNGKAASDEASALSPGPVDPSHD
ncbi:MAG: ion transporter [Phycisphaerae bacterium]|nr:ion transporter [Phycisphaerae bacterium]